MLTVPLRALYINLIIIIIVVTIILYAVIMKVRPYEFNREYARANLKTCLVNKKFPEIDEKELLGVTRNSVTSKWLTTHTVGEYS